jgi:glycosyltransferase involved in cell wall biosynthesis
VTPTIANRSHTPSNLALEHANQLRAGRHTVALFACQETSIDGMAEFLSSRSEVKVPRLDKAEFISRLEEGVHVHVADPRFSLTKRWRDMLVSIGAFDPDLIFFVGLYSPIVVPLFARRPVLGLSINTTPPIVPADAWLCASEGAAGRLSETWCPAIPPAWGIHYPYRIGLNPGRARVPRAEFGVETDTVAFVSVGYRLAMEIVGEWAKQMARFLIAHPKVVWVLIGGDGALPPALATIPRGRVIAIPHRDDVRGMLASCDVYVNPPRMGGGFSIAEAMAEALPIVSYADSDGGDKIGATAVADDDAYFTRLRSLASNPELRRSNGVAMQVRFLETLSLRKSPAPLKAAMRQTLARFIAHRASDEHPPIGTQ